MAFGGVGTHNGEWWPFQVWTLITLSEDYELKRVQSVFRN